MGTAANAPIETTFTIRPLLRVGDVRHAWATINGP